jgi:hypothetical protein
MKSYNVTIMFEAIDRCSNGFPIFGSKVLNIPAINEDHVTRKLNQLYGKGQFVIMDIIEKLNQK